MTDFASFIGGTNTFTCCGWHYSVCIGSSRTLLASASSCNILCAYGRLSFLLWEQGTRVLQSSIHDLRALIDQILVRHLLETLPEVPVWDCQVNFWREMPPVHCLFLQGLDQGRPPEGGHMKPLYTNWGRSQLIFHSLWYPCICISFLFIHHPPAFLAIASFCPSSVHAKFSKASSNKALSILFLLCTDPVSRSPFHIDQYQFTGYS